MLQVKQLLDKVPPELISLDREALAGVDVPTLQVERGVMTPSSSSSSSSSSF